MLFEAGTAEFIMNSKIFEESHNYLLVFVNFYPSFPPPPSFSCFVRNLFVGGFVKNTLITVITIKKNHIHSPHI